MSDAMKMLRDRVHAGVEKRWPSAGGDIWERINFELSVFWACERVEYTLMAADVVEVIRKAGGRIGPGRGASAASAVLYALGITNVDPLNRELLFEIFLTPEKKVPTAVMIETDTKGEQAAREYLAAKYGEIKDLPRRTYAPQLIEVNGWELGLTRTDALDRVSAILELVKENGGGSVDIWNLPKADERTLAAFRRGETGGIPWFDGPIVRGLLSLVRLNAETAFSELCLMSGISYPGLLILRDEALRRYNGSAEVKVDHPLMTDICRETLGLVVYQEQIMLILRRLGGFTRSESDVCRKAIARMLFDKISAFRAKFIAGCLENPEFRVGECSNEDSARRVATGIWNDLERNGKYAYMKAHMICSATLAYQMAYLRSHYLAEWLFLDGKAEAKKPSRTLAKKMDMNHIRYAVLEGCRVTLLMRHAERPPLEPGDTSFGERLPLTERGVETARQLGMSLPSDVPFGCVRTFASNTLRTIQTATCINEGLTESKEQATYHIPLVPELGSDSPFFGKLDERMALISEGGYRDRLNDYFREGAQRGYKPLAEATDKMEAALDRLGAGDKSLVIAVTHDINVAAFLAGRGVVTEFDEDAWPHYLDAAVIICNDEGGREYGYLRHDRSLEGIDL